ncbi:hypothetical protein AB8U03_15520 [Clostridium sp. Mt-5]|uniref:Uncharacterized protein n=1 Tax=Clostridium moutaii TaxID=3240932 RepID=A0ABV4BSV3_9CLOT
MNKSDIEFLKELQNEMLTQDTVSQADPRFWVVMQTVRDYWVDDDVDGFCIYDNNSAENAFEGEFEELVDWLKENFNVIVKCEYDGSFIDIVCEDENEFFTDNISEIEDFLEAYAPGEYSICNYRDREEIAQDTMFLTLRECKKHIKTNGYHYNKPHPYAMTAWRSPQVERLYKILQNTNWDELLNS